MSETADPRPANRLSQSTSPYLLQHAHNPVDWYPWGDEAVETARRLDRPVLLSVGYSACHWWHVMAHESFEDPETAGLMNDLFVNVKVDREERPDVDAIYMSAVQAMNGHLVGRLMASLETPEAVYEVGLGTTRLLMSVGDLVVACLLLRQAGVALPALPTASPRDRVFYEGKVGAAMFLGEYLDCAIELGKNTLQTHQRYTLQVRRGTPVWVELPVGECMALPAEQ